MHHNLYFISALHSTTLRRLNRHVIYVSHHKIASLLHTIGIIGLGLGQFLLRISIFVLGSLFGLVIVVGVLAIPGTEEIVHKKVPLWALVLFTLFLSITLTYALEKHLYIAFTTLVGSSAAACGLDLLLATGFNQEVVRCITSSPDHQHRSFQVFLLDLCHHIYFINTTNISLEMLILTPSPPSNHYR